MTMKSDAGMQSEHIKKFPDKKPVPLVCRCCNCSTDGWFSYSRITASENDTAYGRTNRMVPMCDPCAAKITKGVDGIVDNEKLLKRLLGAIAKV